ncbi:hypothetical protein [Agrobacterium sp. lyk4-40-TYG-31]|uniref:hypothetical protein n=1 Tax=Agrobacterium sp. lyk4-40-TYG-31 TaxID=3040276 RepID=UPI00254A4DFB|nr:hypothetical protein [Agrobacterium sp. lyk4-40-TYG-31]
MVGPPRAYLVPQEHLIFQGNKHELPRVQSSDGRYRSWPFLTNAAAAEDAQSLADGPVFVMLIHPKMILLDLIGPMTVFNMTKGKVHLVWKGQTPVSTDVGIPVAAMTIF